MIKLSFCGGLHKEFKLNESMEFEHKQGMTVGSIIEDLGIDEDSLGLVTINGILSLPADLVEDNNTVGFFPYVMSG